VREDLLLLEVRIGRNFVPVGLHLFLLEVLEDALRDHKLDLLVVEGVLLF